MHRTLSSKKFVVIFSIIVGVFILYHATVWSWASSKIFDASPNYIGDLGRMSYQVDSLSPRVPSSDLVSKHHSRLTPGLEHIDLITLGDSFSNGMASGKNPYYQDHLATALNINVLNIQNLDETFGYIDTVRYLHRNGWLGKSKPKAILIQCVVRESLNHVPSKNNRLSLTPKQLDDALFTSKFTTEFPSPNWINTGNYKLPYYHVAYRFKVRAKKEVYKFPLQKDLFSADAPNRLLVYHDDLNNIDRFTEEAVAALNNDLNLLSDELSKDGITLLFMPSADKYDLYYDYIVHNGDYPKNNFFPLLRELPKRYRLVDTKAILAPLLANGTKDVYYADDTHWSFIASDKIAHDTIFDFLKKVGGE